jgi:hypothetical protein
MIVCSELCEKLEARLVFEGWTVLRVYDAQTALATVRRERFDLVILISTGTEMGIMETFFNLRDIHTSLPVIAVGGANNSGKTIDGEFNLLPNAGVQSVQGMDGLRRLLAKAKAHGNACLEPPVRSHGRDMYD